MNAPDILGTALSAPTEPAVIPEPGQAVCACGQTFTPQREAQTHCSHKCFSTRRAA